MKDWHLQVRLNGEEWHDLGVRPCPEDVHPKDFFTLDLKIADAVTGLVWNIVYEVEET